MRYDSMLLIGVDYQNIGKQLSVLIAYQAITLVDRLLASPAIPRHGHPACVRDNPSFILLMAYHGGEHRKRNLFRFADAQSRHDQVLEDENSCTHFGNAIEVFGEHGRRSRPDAYRGTRNSGLTQAV